MTTYVTYQYQGGFGAVTMHHDKPYNTDSRLQSLIEYIKINYTEGNPVIITGMIKLEEKQP